MQAILETYDGRHGKLHQDTHGLVVVAHTAQEKLYLNWMKDALNRGAGREYFVIELPEAWPFETTSIQYRHVA